jgi:hypothetical protein
LFQGKYYARGHVNGKFIVKKDNSPMVLFIRRGVGHSLGCFRLDPSPAGSEPKTGPPKPSR